MTLHRLFFGLSIESEWPKELPKGRQLLSEQRHITLAFLGEVNLAILLKVLENFPSPNFETALDGRFDGVLFLPRKYPRVVAFHANFGTMDTKVLDYQKKFCQWLEDQGFPPIDGKRKWLPHVTLARTPFNEVDWRKAFSPIPFHCPKIQLYESLGNLHYEPRWTFNLPS